MTTITGRNGLKLNRRRFLGASSGLALGFIAAPGGLLRVIDANASTAGTSLNAWAHIATDGTTSIMLPSSEMGQGIMTSLPLLFADEMDADWGKVKVVQAGVNAVFNNPIHFNIQGIGGSRSIRGYWMPMRQAGANARYQLIANAAERWGVPIDSCATLPGKVVHQASGRELSYGEIAAFAKVRSDVPQLELKPRDQWRLIGRDVPRIEVPTKVNGTAKYGIDVQLPGMLYASILRSPVATCPFPLYNTGADNGPVAVDDSEAMKIEGVVKVVKLDHGVAVIGTDYWATVKGKRALKVEWRKGSIGSTYNTEAKLAEYGTIASDLSRRGTSLLWNAGNADEAFKGAARVVSALYLNDHVHHACMEPFNGTGWLRNGELDLWVSTQGQTWARDVGSKVTGVPTEKVRVHTTLVGGGFGSKVELVYAGEAAALAKAVEGKPVKVIWSREDDIKHGAYRPATAQFLQAAIAADGKIVGYRHRLAGDSVATRTRTFVMERLKGFDAVVVVGASAPYGIPNRHYEYLYQNSGIPVGYWNAVGNGYTTFAVESFMDEVAAALGKDPLALRLELLATDQRSRRVLEEAALMAQWDRKRTEGRALGLAFSHGGEWNAPTAEIVEVSVNRASGRIQVHKVWVAIDPAVAVQPGHLRQQLETGVIWGLSAALRERITIRNGEVQQSNFHDYPVPRMDEIPEIEIRIVESGVMQPSGAGQIGVPPVAPAIANAVARLTGVRLRSIPMLPERVKLALAEAQTRIT